jgi:glutamate--cysteine ligase
MDYSGPDLLSELESTIVEKQAELVAWFAEKRASLTMPVYGSVDIRDANFKVAVVDANQYPAGFNNVDCEGIGSRMKTALGDVDHVHIYPEAHTRNEAYQANLERLNSILTKEGYTVTVGIDIDPAASIILLNNDLTDGPLKGITIPVVPPMKMGWYRRRKSQHFRAVQPLIDEVAAILDIDPWLLGTHWFVSEDKCLDKDTCRILLAAEVDECLKYLQSKYDQYGIQGTPALFVKNDAGTYGMGILEITSGAQLLELSNRKMRKLTYGKGGVEAEDFLLQEGVPTALSSQGMILEPVGYCADGRACCWFYRANAKKGEMTNLNSPSSVFLQPEEIEDDAIASRRDHWHMLVAEIAMLGMALEAQ